MRYFINLLICAMALPLQYMAVPLLLLTKWDGTSTLFGNRLYGRGNSHPVHGTKGFWQEFVWLTYRNPINNLLNALAVPCVDYKLTGNPRIGDKIAGGMYKIKMGKAWEFYYIKPYMKKHCARVRLGWKIEGKAPGEMCPMVFMVRPIMNYSGA